MKRAYSTPDIVFESFSLNENIASENGNCNRQIGTQSVGVCGMEYGNKMVFTVPANGCMVKIEDGSHLLDGLCYHIPTGDNKLFNS